ncbi:PREDICTED: FBD-associated F-box protein At5g56370-like [Camelina sativa]|uniref:FBD-associated F-box protein At5g56370-like n=1 Tax=Camelina sativa TaxID=90675 RepID=A0ABM1R9F6_CAMSA|nr:PREDICTED: FBD-associated F-box protein At5g56370-like [Camelina sativa]
MDRISLLPDECLLQILSSLTTKKVLQTSLLSKRWRNLWKLVNKLEYIYCDANVDHGSFMRFVDRSLLLNKAPVLERLCFMFFGHRHDFDIGFWVRIAVERGLSDFEYFPPLFNSEAKSLPQSLFTCGSLVVLKLTNVSLKDVKFPVSFPVLKKLHLSWVIFLDNESTKKFLSSCQILEVLVLERHSKDNVEGFSITVPSLQKLVYSNTASTKGLFALNAPSLKTLKIIDLDYECIIEKFPEIVVANVEVIYSNTDNILGSLTSLKHLSLCLPSKKSRFPTGKIFHQLVSLEFRCTCDSKWDLLISLFKHSPKLRSLKLNERHCCEAIKEAKYHWGEPISVHVRLLCGSVKPETYLHRFSDEYGMNCLRTDAEIGVEITDGNQPQATVQVLFLLISRSFLSLECFTLSLSMSMDTSVVQVFIHVSA